tara:strand:- start:191 stop:1117 length:927 start_codon:yes stop_codon:yes gene_type:complete
VNQFKVNVNGVLLLDKPKGLSSNKALVKVKKIYNAKKAGHAGTLDPLATGVLPILLGEATKFAMFGLNSDKRYLAYIALGTKTSTGDSEGEIIDKKYFQVDVQQINYVLESVLGEQFQLPPMYSALKYRGKPLYKYARDGIEVSRKKRIVFIRSIRLIALKNSVMTIDVTCSKGTYIRSLSEQIGEKLGGCAHLMDLRRTEVGASTIEESVSLEKLETLFNNSPENLKLELRPVEFFIANLPSVSLKENERKIFLHGQSLRLGFKENKSESKISYRVYDDYGVFLGTGELNLDGTLKPIRLISQQTFN